MIIAVLVATALKAKSVTETAAVRRAMSISTTVQQSRTLDRLRLGDICIKYRVAVEADTNPSFPLCYQRAFLCDWGGVPPTGTPRGANVRAVGTLYFSRSE